MSSPEYERQKRYAKKQKSKNRSKVCVWVPDDKLDELIAFAEDLRESQSQGNERT